ncbi:MAG TPA: aminoacyl-tRNA hydrolase, partial [Dehalococcoidia bacterium]|nr:aminoacyl-tRNA hydrolase [Dehalococcoidia bacterium]
LIVGLGNPGRSYAETRHNVGFWCIDRLAHRLGISMQSKRRYFYGEGRIAEERTFLAKPRTYVNRSGEAVAALLRETALSPQQLLVICDDLDLPVGRLRLRAEGGHGGHNGLRSIIETIGSYEFPRLRIGIGRLWLDGEPLTHPDIVAQYVLSPPSDEERKQLEEAVETGAAACESLIRDGLESAMNFYNRDL